MKNKPVKFLMNLFFKGLLVVLPLWLSGYIIFWAIRKVDRVVDFGIPGVGFLIVIAGITLAGYLVTALITAPITAYFDKLLSKVPVFKLLYTSIRDLMEAFVGEEKKFNEPVIVEMNNSGLKKIGFVTQHDLSILKLNGHVAVYFPHSYNFSGNFFIVPSEKVQRLDSSPTEIMKFVVSGGVSEL